MSTSTEQLSALGVSIWLDDLSRERIASGSLKQLIGDRNVVGVTTNPTIFATALAKGEAYDAQVAELAKAGTSVSDAVFEITTDDVAAASDIFRPVYDATNGQDGRVSIEVEPGLAHDAAGTIAQAKELWAKVAQQGWLGAAIPEEHGGLGLGHVELGGEAGADGSAVELLDPTHAQRVDIEDGDVRAHTCGDPRGAQSGGADRRGDDGGPRSRRRASAGGWWRRRGWRPRRP